MAATCTEKFDSRPAAQGDNPVIELLYAIKDAADEAAALAVLKATAPATWTVDGKTLVRQTCKADPVGDGSVWWNGSAQYGRMSNAKKEVDESSFSFDTGGGTMHVTQGLAHVASYSASIWKLQNAPDHGGAIGVTHDSVEGCDITIPVYTFSETHYLAAETVDNAYKGLLFALTGKTNDAEFKGCAIGECLFLGASGSQRGDESWEITFRFAASPNVEDVCADWPAAAKPTEAVPKKGWEYFWVEYHGAGDDDAKCVVQRPRAAHIEQVYRAGNFVGLAIGT